MEDTSSGSAAIVLATRKHGKLVEKVQGRDRNSWGSWYPANRGRGKGGWKGSGEGNYGGNYGGKGDKGKGKDKGKKGKGRGAQWDQRVAEWGANKEKPEDK